VGALSHGKKIQAVKTALAKAEMLCRREAIVGAVIALEDVFMMTESVNELIASSN
jgi:hypothetical protein